MSEWKIGAAKRRDYRRGGEGSDDEIFKYRKKIKKTKKPYVILWKFNQSSFNHVFPEFTNWSVYRRYETEYKRDQAFISLMSNLREGSSIEYMKENRNEK